MNMCNICVDLYFHFLSFIRVYVKCLEILVKKRAFSSIERICTNYCIPSRFALRIIKTFEPRHEKTNVLHMQKQRRRSDSR